MSLEPDPPEAAKLTGIGKYFNSITNRGRFNVAVATYSGCALIGLYIYFKPKKEAKAEKSE